MRKKHSSTVVAPRATANALWLRPSLSGIVGVMGQARTATTEAEVMLRKLAAKFTLTDLRAASNMPPALLYTFGYELPFLDTVLVRGEDDAAAFRSRIDDDNVNAFPPGNLVWASVGMFVDVVEDLFALPEPGTLRAPSLVIPTPSALWVPGNSISCSLDSRSIVLGL